MKKGLARLTALALLASTIVSQDVNAQEGVVETRRNTGEQITIIRKSDTADKLTIVVDGEKITVNGKPLDENDKSITVNRHKIRDVNAFSFGSRFSTTSDARPNSAMLGITSSPADKGIKILSVTKESAAEKAGLKKDDIIIKIDNDELGSPDALTRKIRSHKPGDKVDVTYLRNGKTSKATAELGKMDEVVVTGFGTANDFDMKFDNNINWNGALSDVQIERIPRVYGQAFGALNGAPKLGLTVQDTDDGKGVTVLSVGDDGNAAKAGIEEDDIILEVDGKPVTSADEIARIMKESKDKTSVKFKYQRDGKTNTVDVKVPRKLKTANL